MSRFIAVMGIMPAEITGYLAGIRVKQQLVVVKAMAIQRIIRAIDTVAIELARRYVLKIAMPDMIGILR